MDKRKNQKLRKWLGYHITDQDQTEWNAVMEIMKPEDPKDWNSVLESMNDLSLSQEVKVMKIITKKKVKSVIELI